MVELNDLEKDTFKEVFNIGIGRAASALSEMVGEEVELSVPSLKLFGREEAAGFIQSRATDRVAAVQQSFHGPFAGSALLIYPEEKSLELVRSILGEEVPLDSLTELEQESLMEVGNVILNACLGSLANMIDTEIHCELPEYLRGHTGTLLATGSDSMDGSGHDQVILLLIDFTVHENNIMGYVVLLFDLSAMSQLKSELGKIIAGLGM